MDRSSSAGASRTNPGVNAPAVHRRVGRGPSPARSSERRGSPASPSALGSPRASGRTPPLPASPPCGRRMRPPASPAYFSPSNRGETRTLGTGNDTAHGISLCAQFGQAMLLKTCIICGRPSPTSRCEKHPKPPKRTGSYGRNAAKVRAAATVCALCGEGPRANDPWVADHIVPRIAGGTDDLSNLLPGHRWCNARKGSQMPSWTTTPGRSRT